VTTRTPLAYDSSPARSSWVLPAAIGGGVLAVAMFALLGWLILKPGAAPATPSNVVKIPIADAPSIAVGDALFQFKTPSVDKVVAGKSGSIKVEVQRLANWNGPITVSLQPAQSSVIAIAPATIAADATSTNLSFRVLSKATSAIVKLIGKAGDYSQEMEVALNIIVPKFTVEALDDLSLAAHEEAIVSVKVTRDGWDDEIVLSLETPQGINSVPPILHIPPEANEGSFRIRSVGRANSGPVRVIGFPGREEKSRFNVSVADASNSKGKMPTPGNEIGVLIGRHSSEIGNIAFSPRDPETLVAWDQTHLSIWESGTKHRAVNKLLDGPSRGTLAPDGKRILSATKSKIYIHDLQGKELTAGPNRYRIIGMYFDVTPTTVLPYFWTPSGLCNAKLTVIQPGAPSAGSIKYSTSGSAVKLSETDGKLKMSGKKNVAFIAPKADDFAVSHDGRWVAIATSSKVLLYDIDASDPATAVWEKDVPNTSSIAVSPDGKTLALGIGKELRLLSVKGKD
jgi:hypothetical protein